MSSPALDQNRPELTVSKPAPTLNTIAVAVICCGLLVAAVWSLIDLRINIASIVDSLGNAREFMARVVPLDFPPFGELFSLIGETLAIVYLATFLSILLSLPVALGAATLTTTGALQRSSSRVVIVTMRAIPDLILAIVFLRLFGLGALPGILAMALHSIGMVAKLYADAIESLDDGPRTAIAAAGGGRWQQIMTGILPALMPQIIATGLHRFDINLRTSVILGYVGIGGIGLAIADAMRTLDYQRGMALAVCVLVLCIAVELLSGAIRAAIMNTSPSSSTSWLNRRWDALTSPVARTQKQHAAQKLTPPWRVARVQRFTGYSFVLVLAAGALVVSDVSWAGLRQGLTDLPITVGLFFPPGGGGAMAEIVHGMVVTVQIGLAATLLGTLLALPIGALAARNVTPNPMVHNFFRVLIVVVRGIPELILAIIFVVITGLGAVAGTLALALGAVGLLSKLVADSLEETDTRVQTALESSGAHRAQIFFSATVRQAGPAFVAHIMYLLDSNIRSATLLGIVGAGGIGFLLLNASRVQQFDVVTTILLFILAVVLIVEALALWVRQAVR